MTVIECKWVSRRWCINLFGVTVTGNRTWITPRVINHESIHTAQMRELLFVPFYLIYGIEWTIRYVLCGKAMRAYENVSFEREAYCNDHNMQYLQQRRRYAWVNYLRKKH